MSVSISAYSSMGGLSGSPTFLSNAAVADVTHASWKFFQNSALVLPGWSPRIKDLAAKPWLQEAIKFMVENFSEELNLDDLATIAGVSKFNFCRQFSKVFKMGPVKFLWLVRLGVASEILKHFDGWDVNETAYACGYTSACHFSRAFRAEFGQSPTAYRKEFQKMRLACGLSPRDDGK
jgi:AraC-like DNA-binding protein